MLLRRRGSLSPKRDEDFGKFLSDLAIFVRNANPPCPELFNLVNENITLFGDIYHGSEYVKKLNPYELIVTYKGHKVSSLTFGSNMLDSQEVESLQRSFVYMVNSMPYTGLMAYLSDDAVKQKAARDYLLQVLDYNLRRNWLNIWAYTDRIKERLPEVYEKMTKEDEFLTVEELWQKVEEQEGKVVKVE